MAAVLPQYILVTQGRLTMTIKRNAIAGVTVQQHQVTMALLTEPLRAPKMIYDAGVTQQPLAANVVEQGVWRDPHAVQVAIGWHANAP